MQPALWQVEDIDANKFTLQTQRPNTCLVYLVALFVLLSSLVFINCHLLLDCMYVCLYAALRLKAHAPPCLLLFLGGEPVPHIGLEYVLQLFYSCFCNESICTEKSLKRCLGKRRGKIVFARVDGVLVSVSLSVFV